MSILQVIILFSIALAVIGIAILIVGDVLSEMDRRQLEDEIAALRRQRGLR